MLSGQAMVDAIAPMSFHSFLSGQSRCAMRRWRDGGNGGDVKIIAGDGVFAEGVTENGGNAGQPRSVLAGIKPGKAGKSGSGGNVILKIGPN